MEMKREFQISALKILSDQNCNKNIIEELGVQSRPPSRNTRDVERGGNEEIGTLDITKKAHAQKRSIRISIKEHETKDTPKINRCTHLIIMYRKNFYTQTLR